MFRCYKDAHREMNRPVGVLRRLYIDNFFSGRYGKTTIGVLDYLFTSTTLFDTFTELTFSSDT